MSSPRDFDIVILPVQELFSRNTDNTDKMDTHRFFRVNPFNQCHPCSLDCTRKFQVERAVAMTIIT
jgi:hypothetical protein